MEKCKNNKKYISYCDIIIMVIKVKTKNEKLALEYADKIKESISNRFDMDKSLLDEAYNKIIDDYGDMIKMNYNLGSIYDNPIIIYKIILSICLNYEFDKDRFDEIEVNDIYKDNFVNRVVAQIIYSDLSGSTFQMSNFLNHPVILALESLASITKYRSVYDINVLRRRLKKDFSPAFILLKEAMESLEGVLLLISNRSFSQAMTVYRLYLEQIITVIALIKNFNLVDKYFEFQNLTIKYARNTSDKDVLKLIEEKKIPARDVKSYLNYGWIEYMDGFNDLPKKRYSIKVMAKLCGMENVYELYSDSTNYVHMNYLYADINWIKEINKVIEVIYATMIGVIHNYILFTGFKFIYKNIDLKAELENIFQEFESITSKKNDDYDVFKLKSA